MSRLLTLLRPKGGPLFLDTFTDANGTNLAAHTPDVDTVGGGWINAATGATWGIASGKAIKEAAGNFRNAAWIDAGTADAQATCQYTQSTRSGGLGLRISDENNCWVVALYNNNDTTNTILLREINAGGVTTRAEAAYDSDDGMTYALKATAIGTTITGFVNGTSLVSYASASFNQAQTKHGLYIQDSDADSAEFDDFRVEAA